MTDRTAEYLEELAQTLASHGSNLAALRMAELEQKVSPYLAPPGVPSALAGGGGSLAGVGTAYAPTVAMGAAGLFITDGAITVTNPGATVIIDGTSNMFKIAATGTLTQAFGAVGTRPGNSVQLTALGNGFTVLPTFLANITNQNSSAANPRFLGRDVEFALASGHVEYYSDVYVYLSSGYVLVSIRAASVLSNPGTTAGCRYYVVVEAGI